MNRKFQFFLLTIILVTGCVQNNDSISLDKNPYDISRLTSNDLPHLKIILRRGAFHYDSFELSGNKLTFTPKETKNTKVEFDFEKKHKVILEDSIALSIFHRLNNNSIFDMDSLYESSTSCNSMLEVEIFFL
ncbi:hypothetical protein [Brumimicrobium mesophilum]|uniref:hypothetical protein n=1 Tax=Brumimicrobium mesophilum TaxID=392717 RepID=UPI000D13F86D|nr:hypothetical protein [Brumimicrobium mesophilum]